MKINKLSAVAALAIAGLMLCGTVNAQDAKEGKKGKRGQSVEQIMDRMNETLKLTDEQKPKVKAVLEESQKKRQELFADSSVTGDDRRTKMQAIMEEQNKKLKEILTAEQYTKWEELRQQLRRGGDKKGEKKE
jgi:protein CpxP